MNLHLCSLLGEGKSPREVQGSCKLVQSSQSSSGASRLLVIVSSTHLCLKEAHFSLPRGHVRSRPVSRREVSCFQTAPVFKTRMRNHLSYFHDSRVLIAIYRQSRSRGLFSLEQRPVKASELTSLGLQQDLLPASQNLVAHFIGTRLDSSGRKPWSSAAEQLR